jgi:hypothetical protein
MKCPFCQNEMGDAADACPRCHRRYAPQVAGYIAQGWNALQGGAGEEARTAFNQALQATPPNDKKQIQSYVAHLFTQAKAPPTAAAAAAAPAHAQPQPRARRQARSAALQSVFQAATVSAPAPRPQAAQPAAGAAQRGLFFNFNERPVNIVRVMDDAKRQQAEFSGQYSQRKRLVALLLPAGLLFVGADVALGYNICTFSLVALVLWVAALVGFFVLRRTRPSTVRAPFSRRSRMTCRLSAPSSAGWT